MKRLILSGVVLGILAQVIFSSAFVEQQQPEKTGMHPHEFAFTLLTELASDTSNTCFSPFSIHMALSMAALGAKGETKSQMMSSLALPNWSEEDLIAYHDHIITSLYPSDHIGQQNLLLANSLWIDHHFPVSPSFVDKNMRFYRSEVQTIDVLDPKAPDRINQWVSEATKGKIPTIIDSLPSQMRMMIIQAIYFLSDWEQTFESYNTFDRPFYTTHGKISTPFMHKTARFSPVYLEDGEGIVLSYTQERFKFFALLPPKESAIRDWLSMVDTKAIGSSLFQQISHNQKVTTKLGLPMFTVESSYTLSSPLKKMGMVLPFSPYQADFSLLQEGSKEQIFIDEVLHKAYIDVHEKGTEAAAVTAVIMRATSVIIEERELIFDRPFLYGIVDTETESLLFLGIMDNPKS